MNDSRSLVPLLSNSPRLQIEEVPIEELKPNTRSPRRHPEKQIAMLARSMATFSFLVPCLTDEENRLLSGDARVAAAARLGMTRIPVIRVQHLSEAEKRAYIIADNKLAEMAVWNRDVLRSELQFFTELNIDFRLFGHWL
jgi:ParB-like chromosome segregation protein Spo0J